MVVGTRPGSAPELAVRGDLNAALIAHGHKSSAAVGYAMQFLYGAGATSRPSDSIGGAQKSSVRAGCNELAVGIRDRSQVRGDAVDLIIRAVGGNQNSRADQHLPTRATGSRCKTERPVTATGEHPISGVGGAQDGTVRSHGHKGAMAIGNVQRELCIGR